MAKRRRAWGQRGLSCRAGGNPPLRGEPASGEEECYNAGRLSLSWGRASAPVADMGPGPRAGGAPRLEVLPMPWRLPGEVTDRSVMLYMTGAVCTQPAQVLQTDLAVQVVQNFINRLLI